MSIAHDAASLPPELARLGPAEQVFDLSAGKISRNNLQIVAGCAVGALACFTIAIPLLVCGIKPFGQNAPPPAVCFAGAGILGALALALAYGAYQSGTASRRAAGAYYLFRDCLVVVTPGKEPRRIDWGQMGPEKGVSPWDPRHEYPVDGEADLAFDYSSADHEELAAAITQESTRARWNRILPPAAVSGLIGGRPAPAFLVYDPADTGQYRVSPLAGYLLFVQVGDGCLSARMGTGAGGLAGAAAGWQQMKQVERLQKALGMLEGADERRLFEIAAGFRGSRLIAPRELSGLHFAASTVWGKMSTGISAVAALTFKHAEWGEKTMYFESLDQLSSAAQLLQETLGRDFRHELARLSTQV
jgi:hypothetical protein